MYDPCASCVSRAPGTTRGVLETWAVELRDREPDALDDLVVAAAAFSRELAGLRLGAVREALTLAVLLAYAADRRVSLPELLMLLDAPADEAVRAVDRLFMVPRIGSESSSCLRIAQRSD